MSLRRFGIGVGSTRVLDGSDAEKTPEWRYGGTRYHVPFRQQSTLHLSEHLHGIIEDIIIVIYRMGRFEQQYCAAGFC